MNDPFQTFSAGVQLQDNLMTRALQRQAMQQEYEQKNMEFPVQMQTMQTQAQAAKVALVHQANQNQIQQQALEDSVKISSWFTDFQKNPDAPFPDGLTPDGLVKAQKIKSDSDVSRGVQSTVAAWNQTVAKLPVDYVGTAIQIWDPRKSPAPTKDQWDALGMVAQQADDSETNKKIETFRTQQGILENNRLKNQELRNQGAMDQALIRYTAGSGKLSPEVKGAMLKEMDVIKASTLPDDRKLKAMDDIFNRYTGKQEGAPVASAPEDAPETNDRTSLDNLRSQYSAIVAAQTKAKASDDDNQHWFGIGGTYGSAKAELVKKINAAKAKLGQSSSAPASSGPSRMRVLNATTGKFEK
jgi:hypothetical protein